VRFKSINKEKSLLPRKKIGGIKLESWC